jgi:hypothetical protein
MPGYNLTDFKGTGHVVSSLFNQAMGPRQLEAYTALRRSVSYFGARNIRNGTV